MSNSLNNYRIGEVLQKAHLISPAQIEVALRDQQMYLESNLGYLKLGEILALRGWLKQETADFFVKKWFTLLNQGERKPLGYYLQEAALLSEQQIYYLIEEQQKLSMRLRLGELAYLEGWLNPKTVNFFINNLSNLPRSQKIITPDFSQSQKHQLLQQYKNGKTNFNNLNLNQVYLQKTNLRGINLDYSELHQASLQEINLSYSSLKGVNFSWANLTRASLKKTDLRNANLQGANLSWAFMEEANLKQANLQGANLRQASLIKAFLDGADLRDAKLQGTLLYGASYDRHTRFDPSFDPLQAGMKFNNIEFGYSRVLFS